MEIRASKTVAESKTEQVQVVMPKHLNGAGKLFGGQLAMWIDQIAGIVAMRHSGRMITTAAIDNLRFRESVDLGALVVLRGKVTYVGSSSIEVRVDSYVESLSGERKLINTAFVIEVALDEQNRPCQVPGLACANAFEQQEFSAGARRRELRRTLEKDIYE